MVLERINLQVKEGEFCSMVGASGCGKSTFLRLLLGQENRPVVPSCSTASRWRRSRTAVVVWSSSAIRCFRISNVLDNVAIGLELPASPLLGRLFGGRKREARQQAQRMLEKVGRDTPRINTRRSSRAGYSSGWPLPGVRDAAAGAAAGRALRRAGSRHSQGYACAAAPAVERNAHDGVYGHPRPAEGFNLGTRLLVFDKVRIDPQAPNAWGARITYDIPLNEARMAQLAAGSDTNVYALRR